MRLIEGTGIDLDDPRVQECLAYLDRQAQEIFAHLGEGHCHRCKGRLLPSDVETHRAYCPGCDAYWNWDPEAGSWSNMVGWFARGDRMDDDL